MISNLRLTLKNIAFSGLFFCLIILFWGVISTASANVVTSYGLDKGDQTQAQEFFHQGLLAYLDSDFDNAYRFWKQSESQGHAKSTFNIGLMWLSGQVPQQDINEQQAESYFKKSLNLGYLPAENYINSSASENISVANQLEINSQPENQTHSNNNDSKNEWLNSYSESDWVLQVFATQDQLLLEQMIADNNLHDSSKILVEKINNEFWFKLIYGKFSSREEALNAIVTY